MYRLYSNKEGDMGWKGKGITYSEARPSHILVPLCLAVYYSLPFPTHILLLATV